MSANNQQPTVFITVIFRISVFLLLPFGGYKYWQMHQQAEQHQQDEQAWEREIETKNRENAELNAKLEVFKVERENLMRDLQEKAEALSQVQQEASLLEQDLASKSAELEGLQTRISERDYRSRFEEEKLRDEIAGLESHNE